MSQFDELWESCAQPNIRQHFGEALTYYPAGGGQRSIVGVVSQSGDVGETEIAFEQVDRIEVLVERNATDGIDDPQMQDGLTRDSDGSNAEPYVWTCEKLQVMPGSWVLPFERRKPLIEGGNRISQ